MSSSSNVIFRVLVWFYCPLYCNKNISAFVESEIVFRFQFIIVNFFIVMLSYLNMSTL